MPRSPTPLQALGKLIEQSTQPLLLLSDEAEVIYCNAAAGKWLRAEPSVVVSHICRYGGPSDPSAVCDINQICPPPTVFEGQRASLELARRDPSTNSAEAWLAEFSPIMQGEDLLAVLIHLRPCTAVAPPPSSAEAHRWRTALVDFRQQAGRRFQLDRFVGHSSAIVRARAQAVVAADSGANITIVGPPGAGKEHLAKAIHYRRAAAAPGPLVTLSAVGLNQELLESALVEFSPRVEKPQGTLILSAAERLPEEALAALFKFACSGRAQVIACAEQSLFTAKIAQASPELVSCLATIEITLPPLAQRAADLPLLAHALIEEINTHGEKQVAGFVAEALDRLSVYHWPGNIEQLAAVLAEAHDRANGSWITHADLPRRFEAAFDAGQRARRTAEPIVLDDFLREVELELIRRALAQAKGNKAKAARLLGLSRPRLYRRMLQLGLIEAPQGWPTSIDEIEPDSQP